MRTLGLTYFALFAAVATVTAQDPKAQPAKTPPAGAAAMSQKNQQYLDAYLDVWEKRMAKINALETKIVLTETGVGSAQNPGKKAIYTGEASLLKPNHAKMLLKDSGDPGNAKHWRHFVADGQHLWEYLYGQKIARVAQLPKDGVSDHMMMSFLFGMKAADVKKRFDVSVDVENPDKHNDFYLHINILPKSKEDMQDFKKAELVLWKNNKDSKYADLWMLPARLWFQNVEGDQVTWEFKNMSTEKKFLPADFKAPGFPDKDWRSEWAKPPQPTVTRTSAPPK